MSNVGSIAGKSGPDLLGTGNVKFSDNMFLKLLVAEMRTQSPLSPVDNQSFMEQMAQFSSMEQTKQMNDGILQLLSYQGILARMQGLQQGADLIGKTVIYKTEDGKEGSGVVQGVRVEDGKTLLDLGGKTIRLAWVTGIKAGSTSQKTGKKGTSQGNNKN
ncbi:MAG TPA: hypothetical protein ENJ97_03645 [Planctomycetes bacterium]|nr:hypothetical protein [Planctomycetota bacterium]